MQPVRYTLSVDRPSTHLVGVTMEIPDAPPGHVDVALPAWTPGSYRIRDFARHVQEFEARRGRTRLAWEKTDKQTWRIRTGKGGRVRITFQVFTLDVSSRTSYLLPDYGCITGTSHFPYIPGETARPADLVVRVPRDWNVAVPLQPVRGKRNAFRAATYDDLVDAPIALGKFRILPFRVRNLPHRLTLFGETGIADRTLLSGMRKIVAAHARLFGGLPYREYLFIAHFGAPVGGGTEHENSCNMLFGGTDLSDDRQRTAFFGLVSHEFFHTWNVKRIRPANLTPYDYSREQHTRLLWGMEGFTSYYGPLLLVRAGLMTPRQFLDRYAGRITELERLPGRKRMSLDAASWNAWIEEYQPSPQTPNRAISYYHKGMIVGFLLDLAIRNATDGRKSLDDVMRILWRRHGKPRVGLSEDGFHRAVGETAGRRIRSFLQRCVAGTGPLPYGRHLGSAGLALSKRRADEPEEPYFPWRRRPRYCEELGLWMNAGERHQVEHVETDGPGDRAGIAVGDEIAAVDGHRIPPGNFQLPAGRNRGKEIAVTLFRNGELLELRIRPRPAGRTAHAIEPVRRPSKRARRIYRGWLGEALQPSDERS